MRCVIYEKLRYNYIIYFLLEVIKRCYESYYHITWFKYAVIFEKYALSYGVKEIIAEYVGKKSCHHFDKYTFSDNCHQKCETCRINETCSKH